MSGYSVPEFLFCEQQIKAWPAYLPAWNACNQKQLLQFFLHQSRQPQDYCNDRALLFLLPDCQEFPADRHKDETLGEDAWDYSYQTLVLRARPAAFCNMLHRLDQTSQKCHHSSSSRRILKTFWQYQKTPSQLPWHSTQDRRSMPGSTGWRNLYMQSKSPYLF